LKYFSEKDLGSSVESATESKSLVEKLKSVKSDVKGLKNALKRSKRSKDKPGMLTRMSHVQSSDEFPDESKSTRYVSGRLE